MVGIGQGMGPAPSLDETYDPKSREHVLAGTYPTEADVTKELDGLSELLDREDILVLRPDVLDINQVFTRDIGIVVGENFIMTHMVEDRRPEQQGLNTMLHRNPGQVLYPPSSVRMEGGDVMPMGSELWVGYSGPLDFERFTTSRTNAAALDWLSASFPNWKVRGFELAKSDLDPRRNALHLDCCFSPLGLGHAIFHAEGLKHQKDVDFIRSQYPRQNLLEVSAAEMYNMHCNLFSIAPDTVVSGLGFDRVNQQMREWGYRVLELPYRETAKMEGLLRCTTLPLRRTP
jgi:N-dimethylarginine dimethylaminohydrolase